MKIAIYIRTSTLEQTPELQLRDISSMVNLDEVEIFKDKQSAFKDNIEREEFNNLKKLISSKKINEIYVWDLDRIYRNRKNLISFFQYCDNYKCKVYSYRQQWLNELNNIQKPFNEIMFNLMLNIMGWLAEEESQKKSDRIKNAVKKKNNKTLSYKGNKWGRPKTEIDYKTKLLIQKDLQNHLSIRMIVHKYNIKKHIIEKIKKETLFTNHLNI